MEREAKIKVLRIFVSIVLVMHMLFGFIICLKAQNAGTILDKATSAYESSNGMTAAFTLHSRSEIQGMSDSFEGTINMKGDKFTLETPDMKTWFDGKTQWAYVDRNDEVNVTEPTGDELQLTNPALLLRSSKNDYTSVYKGESTAPNGKAAYDLVLTPKKKSDITRVELQIEKLSGLPASITMVTKNGITSTVRISRLKTGVNQPDSFFVFKEADYPDAEIVDLR